MSATDTLPHVLIIRKWNGPSAAVSTIRVDRIASAAALCLTNVHGKPERWVKRPFASNASVTDTPSNVVTIL